MTGYRICLIEDDEIMGGALTLRFELEGMACDWLKTGKAALASLRKQSYGVVVSDIRLPDMSGETLYMELLESSDAPPPFIFMTGHGAVEQAVRLLKRGAVDYLLKPFEPDLLMAKLKEFVSCVETGLASANDLGVSAAMRSVDELLPRLAQSQASVLITGESGVGKEQVAHKLHDLRGTDRPFVAANCGAFTESLLEAELFGHEKGAFTGAVRTKHGLFEQAKGGTLFLDEIGDMPLSMQVKVLRAIQERQIKRVGGESAIATDFCLITATHQDLKTLVEQGLFREDLFYRINVIQVRVPPLRERREDIIWLANRFLDQINQSGDEQRRFALTPAAERALIDHSWPGNVRELKHLLERAQILATGPLITPELLFGEPSSTQTAQVFDTLSEYIAGHEREYIQRALESQDWQIQETANLLGISRKNLWEKMKKLQILRPNAPPSPEMQD